MNCIEARNLFEAFWRRTLAADRRLAVVEHLKSCAGCDRSFRALALSAPALWMEPGELRAAEPARRAAGRAAGYTINWAGARPRFWLGGALAASMLVAAGLAAYLAVRTPVESFDEIASPDVTASPIDTSTDVISASYGLGPAG